MISDVKCVAAQKLGGLQPTAPLLLQYQNFHMPVARFDMEMFIGPDNRTWRIVRRLRRDVRDP
jgi:hypothetical protein